MNYRTLPRADLQVSELSFGCMSLQGSHRENARLLHKAFDAGINYFDTADLYQNGANEETVGKALKDRREQVILATKVGNEMRADGSGWDWNPSKKYITKAVDKSLQRLQTDYIDLYQLHGGTIDDPIGETIEAFEELVTAGKIRHYGISSIRPNVIREYLGRAQIISNMMQYSLLDRRPEEEVMHLLHEQGVGVMVRGALAKGVLAGKDVSRYLNYPIQVVDLLLNKMKSFSIEKTPLSHMAIQWALANRVVSSVVLGIRTEAQLAEAIGYYDTPFLSDEELVELSSVLKPNIYTDHR
jgi:aryl-alcohol dehydrogenase-like predicted oxidoreductase